VGVGGRASWRGRCGSEGPGFLGLETPEDGGGSSEQRQSDIWPCILARNYDILSTLLTTTYTNHIFLSLFFCSPPFRVKSTV
jgi:hypothetical protein